MRTCVTGILISCLLLLASPGVAQECGDVNGDATINIGDVVRLIDAITHPEYMDDPSFYRTEADCDGRAGITMSDVVTVCDYLFRGDDHRDCSAAGTYSLTPALDDTVFIPYMNNIPIDVTEIDLPIMASLLESTDGVYISLLTDASTTDDLFNLTEIDIGNPGAYIAADQYYPDGDSCSLEIIELTEGGLTGERIVYFNLEFTRYSDAVGSIAPTEYIRSPLWRITVEKDGDLFIPVIVFYEVVLPDPTLTVDPTSLSFTAVSGETDDASYEISFTSTERPVTFDLYISEPWLGLDGNPVGPYTTPVSFWVTADATLLLPDSYSGTITPISLVPAEAILVDGVVTVDFTVNPEPDLPWGDINCDGYVSISDIALMIDCVFIFPRPIPPCQ